MKTLKNCSQSMTVQNDYYKIGLFYSFASHILALYRPTIRPIGTQHRFILNVPNTNFF